MQELEESSIPEDRQVWIILTAVIIAACIIIFWSSKGNRAYQARQDVLQRLKTDI